MKCAIVTAAPFEQELITSTFKKLKIPYYSLFLGVGALQAAWNAQKVALKCKGKPVIFFGTCGLFGKFANPALYYVDSVYWEPTCERIGKSYGIKNLSPPQILDNKATSIRKALKPISIVCGPSISLTQVSSKVRIRPNHAIGENIELYSFVPLLKQHSSKYLIFMASTNAVGKKAHDQWLQNHKKGELLLANFIEEHQNYFLNWCQEAY